MSTFYNAQINNKDKKYSIQFETENYEWFKEVEEACQEVIDKSNSLKSNKKNDDAGWFD